MGDKQDPHRQQVRELTTWFGHVARDLPWRTDPRDPYASLVSELMLQQTQVSRVIERFGAFMERFPSVHDLARAPEQDVLGLWSGLGYYRRARLLHACAKAIVERHDGVVPSDPKALKDLPGIGAYTSGAIASIVFSQRVPAVDGNVVRVMLRVHNHDAEQNAPKTLKWTQAHTQSLLDASDDPGAVSEALMELGATVCTPQNPRCDACPWSEHCDARAQGTTASIPRPKARAAKKDLHVACALVRAPGGMFLVEQRASSGLWASMWQPPSLEHPERSPSPEELAAHSGANISQQLGSFTHITTHRNVHFTVYLATKRDPGEGRKFVTIGTARTMGFSSAHERAVTLSDNPE